MEQHIIINRETGLYFMGFESNGAAKWGGVDDAIAYKSERRANIKAQVFMSDGLHQVVAAPKW